MSTSCTWAGTRLGMSCASAIACRRASGTSAIARCGLARGVRVRGDLGVRAGDQARRGRSCRRWRARPGRGPSQTPILGGVRIPRSRCGPTPRRGAGARRSSSPWSIQKVPSSASIERQLVPPSADRAEVTSSATVGLHRQAEDRPAFESELESSRRHRGRVYPSAPWSAWISSVRTPRVERGWRNATRWPPRPTRPRSSMSSTPREAQPREGGVEVRHGERHVVEALAALGHEAGDRALRVERPDQLDGAAGALAASAPRPPASSITSRWVTSAAKAWPKAATPASRSATT